MALIRIGKLVCVGVCGVVIGGGGGKGGFFKIE